MSLSDRDQEPERAEQAFRQAFRDELPGANELDPAGVRRRLARRRTATAAVAAAAVLVVGAVALPRFLTSPQTPVVAATPSTGGQPSPAIERGWRLEQYRSVTVQVPDSWGYAYAPGSDWCVDSPDGKPTKERMKPYVSLGGSAVVRQIACPAEPDSLLTEHLEVAAVPTGGSATLPPSSQMRGDWWIFTRIVTEADAHVMVQAVSKDRELAERIAASAVIGGGACAPTSPVQKVGNRAAEANVDALAAVDQLVVCQYEPSQDGGPAGGLRAARSLHGEQAQALATALGAALADGPEAATGCTDVRTPLLELALTVQVRGSAPVFVTTGTCIDPADANTSFGGVDGGGRVRELTPALCRQVVRPPVRIDSWARGVPLCER